MTTQSLGDRVKKLREGQGLTQQRLADKLGVSQSTIKMIEKNERKPSLKLLEDICLCFGSTKNFILEGEESSQSTYSKQYKNLSGRITEGFTVGGVTSENTALVSTSDLLKSLVLTRKITTSNNLSSEVKDLISKILRLEIDTLLEIYKGKNK